MTSKTKYIEILQNLAAKKGGVNKLAIHAAVDSGTMSRILSGNRILSYRVALRICDNLGLSSKERVEFLSSIEASTKNVDKGERSKEYLDRRVQTKKAIKNAKANANGSSQNPSQDKKPADKKDGVELTAEQIEEQEKIRDAVAKLDRSLMLNKRNVTYFITTAIEGAELMLPAMNAVENFLKRNDAQLIIIPSRAHLRPLSDTEYPLDDYILENHQDSVFRNVNLCSVLDIKDMDIRPYTPDPLSGLKEEGADRGTSLIVAHPQQRDKTYAVGVGNHCRRQMSTGAITLPYYRPGKSGLLADRNHVMGGTVVEVTRSGKFFARHVQFIQDGSFCDFGTVYQADGSIRKIAAAGLNRGDEHSGFTCPKTKKALDEITAEVQPKKIFIQDLFEAATVSHHREKSMMAMISVPAHINTLEKELAYCSQHLADLNSRKPKGSDLYIIPSNHNDHLFQYLDQRRFVNDKVNFCAAIEASHILFNLKKDPLQVKVDPDQKYAIWLKRTDTLKVAGVTIHHGDAGENGSRGTVRQDRSIYGQSSGGHSHSPEKWRGATRVGTSTILNMDYVEGKPSSWANAAELIYESPEENNPWRQLIFIIDGRYKADFGGTKKAKKK